MPIYSLKACMLRIKQTNGLDFSTVIPISPSPSSHSATLSGVFHEIPRAAGPRQQRTKCDRLAYLVLWAICQVETICLRRKIIRLRLSD